MATNKIFKITAIVAIMLFSTAGLTRAQRGDQINWPVLIHQLDSTRQALNTMPDDTTKLASYYFICKYSYDVDSAGKYSKLLLDLALELNEQYYIAHGYSYLARYYTWAGDYDNARDANMEAIYMWEKLENKHNLARVNTNHKP